MGKFSTKNPKFQGPGGVGREVWFGDDQDTCMKLSKNKQKYSKKESQTSQKNEESMPRHTLAHTFCGYLDL